MQPGSHVRRPEDITAYPEFSPHSKSLAARALDREMWEKYKDMRDKYGFSFRQAIFPGVRNPDMEGGVYAGSEDSYLAFFDLFERIIKDLYGSQALLANQQS